MKKLLLLVGTILLIANCSKVTAGNVGLKIYTLGSDKGDIELLGLGRHWIGWNEELVIFPTSIQNYEWTASETRMSPNNEELEFQSKEGLKITADVSISFQLVRDKIPDIFKKYRKGVEELIDVELRNETQKWLNQLAGDRTADEIYGSGKTKLINEVREKLEKRYDKEGVKIRRLAWVGAIRLPDKIKEGIDLKMQAIQRAEKAQYEEQESVAEARKEVAEAKGKAEAMKYEKQQITKALLDKMWIEKWDGKLPTIMTGGKTSSIINIPDLK